MHFKFIYICFTFQSLGCLLYAMCFYKSPFEAVYERGDSVALAVLGGNISFPDPASHQYSDVSHQYSDVGHQYSDVSYQYSDVSHHFKFHFRIQNA